VNLLVYKACLRCRRGLSGREFKKCFLKTERYDLRFGDRAADDWASVVLQVGNCSGQECSAGAIDYCQLDGY